jgi:pimeloyl-ACP methyl ester carboxylesterase
MAAERVDIGGRRLSFIRDGYGAPTVVLEAGLGDTSDTWSQVQPAVARFACVCSYDRAGLGRSDPALTPRTCQDMVADLHALLRIAEIEPPYILVGHSFGGMNVRLYASQHPDEVAGMVLIDASHEDKDIRFEQVLSEELIQRHRAHLNDPSRNSEHVDKLKSAEQVRTADQRFMFPLIALTRGRPDAPSAIWPVEALQRVETELQREFLKLSPRSRHILAERSGHFIHHDEPELVIEAIRRVAAEAREATL